jgi:hypothetical protein
VKPSLSLALVRIRRQCSPKEKLRSRHCAIRSRLHCRPEKMGRLDAEQTVKMSTKLNSPWIASKPNFIGKKRANYGLRRRATSIGSRCRFAWERACEPLCAISPMTYWCRKISTLYWLRNHFQRTITMTNIYFQISTQKASVTWKSYLDWRSEFLITIMTTNLICRRRLS